MSEELLIAILGNIVTLTVTSITVTVAFEKGPNI